MKQVTKEFAEKYNVSLSIGEATYGYHFFEDKVKRYSFPCTLKRTMPDGTKKSYSFKFGQSIMMGNTPPTMYDVLSTLTKYDPETFEDFCQNFGYKPNKETLKNYKECVELYDKCEKEYNKMEEMFGNNEETWEEFLEIF